MNKELYVTDIYIEMEISVVEHHIYDCISVTLFETAQLCKNINEVKTYYTILKFK